MALLNSPILWNASHTGVPSSMSYPKGYRRTVLDPSDEFEARLIFIAAISKSLKIFCFIYSIVFAYIADDGGVIISPNTESNDLRSLVSSIVGVAQVPGNEFV